MSLDIKRSFPVGMVRKPRSGSEPKKLQVKKRLLGKWRKHPVDKLVELANFLETTNPVFAAKVWIRLLDSCELEENKKRTASPPLASETETGATLEAMQSLEELENEPKGVSKVSPKQEFNGVSSGEAV